MARRKYKLHYKLKVKGMAYDRHAKKWRVSMDVKNDLIRSLCRLGLDPNTAYFLQLYTPYKVFKGHAAFKRARAAAITFLEMKQEDGSRLFNQEDVIIVRTRWKNGRRWNDEYWWEDDKEKSFS
jgi:hypothetical protein